MDELIKISKNENGIVTVSSKQVAENFGKEHTSSNCSRFYKNIWY